MKLQTEEKRRPIIGITPSITDGVVRMNRDYLTAIFDAGGIPVFLPFTSDPARIAEYVELADGLLFSGGGDVDPAHYGEARQTACGESDAARDSFELALFTAFYPTGKPILGICRGEQLLNVALGGTLTQHLDGHRQDAARDVCTHRVTIADGTKLAAVTGAPTLQTNSFHHQAVAKVAPTLRLAALSDDGVPEAVEATDGRFLIGVQWHPEAFYRHEPRAAALFEAFVRAAAEEIGT